MGIPSFRHKHIRTVLVVGAGFIGAGIAQVCAQSGYSVFLSDVNASALEKAKQGIEWSLSKLAQKGLLKEPVDLVLQRIVHEQTLRVPSNVDLIIEAATEMESTKLEIFAELDRQAAPGAILATSTSSIPISRISKMTNRPQMVIGLHFFGPVPLNMLVEVVKGSQTLAEVVEETVTFVKSLGKTPIQVQKDVPGFVINRIFFAAMREAVDLVDQGIVAHDDVDLGMRLGYGWTLGPFEIVDIMGLDTYALITKLMRSLGEETLVPKSNMIEKMVKQGDLGRKARRGFYVYSCDGRPVKRSSGDKKSYI